MMPVWENIAQQRLSWQQCHTLLEQIFFAGAYGTQDHNSRLKTDYRRLTDLNEKIAAQAAALSALLTEQGQILLGLIRLYSTTTPVVPALVQTRVPSIGLSPADAVYTVDLTVHLYSVNQRR
ncbi:hypothetical protein [Serratia marcescens]|uniref:hypothetical protein n=1 Tax=Serratia marcescens TaxID=615 RepID=UPI003EDF5416